MHGATTKHTKEQVKVHKTEANYLGHRNVCRLDSKGRGLVSGEATGAGNSINVLCHRQVGFTDEGKLNGVKVYFYADCGASPNEHSISNMYTWLDSGEEVSAAMSAGIAPN